ncbi:MAG: class I SAM-dependent methyltransferase [Oscillospiraceae bacterium]|nr:class I SAM-dependent methyltransferase [Oscillospiraceae bacterium]
MSDIKLKLSKRLAAVANFIPIGAAIVDIGTDHGYLPVYLAQNELTSRIIATDISKNSLNSAIESAKKYEVSDKITFLVADGLHGIEPNDVDTIVLAGMGGETIKDILAAAPWTREKDKRLIIQAQSKLDILCPWLDNFTYIIHDATLVKERNKLYTIMLVSPSEHGDGSFVHVNEGTVLLFKNEQKNRPRVHRVLSEPDGKLLLVLSAKKDPLLPEYLDMLIYSSQKTALGTAISSPADSKRWYERIERLKLLKEPSPRSLYQKFADFFGYCFAGFIVCD